MTDDLLLHCRVEPTVPISSDYLAFVLEQLAGLEGVVWRRMFGGVGLYQEELFFGLIADDTLYLRADDSNRADYTARGAAPFRPYADRPHVSMSYFEAPADVLDDARTLTEWARRSIAVAQRAPAPKKRKAVSGNARRAVRRHPRTPRAKR
jgi:DNA transformation protein and related proteins